MAFAFAASSIDKFICFSAQTKAAFDFKAFGFSGALSPCFEKTLIGSSFLPYQGPGNFNTHRSTDFNIYLMVIQLAITQWLTEVGVFTFFSSSRSCVTELSPWRHSVFKCASSANASARCLYLSSFFFTHHLNSCIN